jgi:hypothetical protein
VGRIGREKAIRVGSDCPDAVRRSTKCAEKEPKLVKRFAKMEDDKSLSSFDAETVIWSAMECADEVDHPVLKWGIMKAKSRVKSRHSTFV